MPVNKKNIIFIESTQYILTLLVTALITTLVFHLWEIELDVPFSYSWDFLSHSVVYKTIMETGWAFGNPSIGAPFGSSFYLDYPTSDGFHYFIGLILSFFTRESTKLYNIYFLGGFLLSALSALFALKKMNIHFSLALPGAVSFAFLPYHFIRYQHIFLASYYMIPFGLIAFWEVVNGTLNVVTWNQHDKKLHWHLKQPKFWFYVLICFLLASSGVYYAIFIAFIGLITGIRCLFLKHAEDRLSRAINCLPFVFILVLTAAMNSAPSYIYKYTQGVTSEPAVMRSERDVELYGLKIIQLLLPSPIHRFSSLAAITQSYNAEAPLVNENRTASLGLIGAIGFLYSLLFLFRGQGDKTNDDYLSFVNIFCVLLATIGGFGSAFGFLISPMIRGYNRISVIIGFISIAVFCRLVQHITSVFQRKSRANMGRKKTLFTFGLSLLLLGVVFVDQCYYPNVVEIYRQIKVRYEIDEKFAKRIDKSLPDGAMIFQLPFVPFPENGLVHNMEDYDHFRPYLLTKGLRWSYGSVKGRYASDWYKYTAQLPTEQMLQRLAAKGFSGIYVDRFGYADAGKEIETKIKLYIQTKPINSMDKRFVFYDFRSYVKEYRSKFSDNQWRAISAEALELEPILVSLGECSPMEEGSGNQWIWCGDQGELFILDYGGGGRNATLSFHALTATGEPALLFTRIGSREEQFEISGVARPIQLIVPIPAGKTSVKIYLESNAHELEIGDPRELVIRLDNPAISIKEVAESP